MHGSSPRLERIPQSRKLSFARTAMCIPYELCPSHAHACCVEWEPWTLAQISKAFQDQSYLPQQIFKNAVAEIFRLMVCDRQFAKLNCKTQENRAQFIRTSVPMKQDLNKNLAVCHVSTKMPDSGPTCTRRERVNEDNSFPDNSFPCPWTFLSPWSLFMFSLSVLLHLLCLFCSTLQCPHRTTASEDVWNAKYTSSGNPCYFPSYILTSNSQFKQSDCFTLESANPHPCPTPPRRITRTGIFRSSNIFVISFVWAWLAIQFFCVLFVVECWKGLLQVCSRNFTCVNANKHWRCKAICWQQMQCSKGRFLFFERRDNHAACLRFLFLFVRSSFS